MWNYVSALQFIVLQMFFMPFESRQIHVVVSLLVNPGRLIKWQFDYTSVYLKKGVVCSWLNKCTRL